MTKPAVFLDRDGTINEEVNYLSRIEQFRFIDGAIEAIRRLNASPFLVIVITNQAGVARGLYPERRVGEIHDYLRMQLNSSGAVLDGIYYCPHHPTAGQGRYKVACKCRKPEPGLLYQAARDLDIDLRASYMIGDKLSDIQAGQAAGCRTILVRTGYGAEIEKRLSDAECRPDYIAANVLEAVDWILAEA